VHKNWISKNLGKRSPTNKATMHLLAEAVFSNTTPKGEVINSLFSNFFFKLIPIKI
jgi:hypothetical protein